MRIPFKKSFRALLEVVSSRENDRSNDKYTSKGGIQGLGHNLKHEAYLMYNLPKYYISFQFQVRDSKLKKKKPMTVLRREIITIQIHLFYF